MIDNLIVNMLNTLSDKPIECATFFISFLSFSLSIYSLRKDAYRLVIGIRNGIRVLGFEPRISAEQTFISVDIYNIGRRPFVISSVYLYVYSTSGKLYLPGLGLTNKILTETSPYYQELCKEEQVNFEDVYKIEIVGANNSKHIKYMNYSGYFYEKMIAIKSKLKLVYVCAKILHRTFSTNLRKLRRMRNEM